METKDILGIISSIVGVMISSFIAYHIYYLSKKLTFKDNWQHRKYIQKKVKQLESEISNKNRRNKIYLVDIDMYNYYPNLAPNDRPSHIDGALKDYHLGGVRIQRREQVPFIDENGNNRKAFKFGIIPYEWIVDIEMEGDDINTSPLIYCDFKNKKGQKDETIKYTPFKYYEYYLINDKYNEMTDYPWQMFGEKIEFHN